MKNLSDTNKVEFYKFLNGERTVEELRDFIYSQPDLEQQLESAAYFSLIELNFNDKYDRAKLPALIKNSVVEEGQFETWKLRTLLNNFLSDVSNTHINLDKFYHLYCGIYQDEGQRRYEYKFLSNLGLNYLYWADEDYMKVNAGANWEAEYNNCFKDFAFYHAQLKPFAEEILGALDENKIQILNDGTYLITDELKAKLETKTIYKLKHPGEP